MPRKSGLRPSALAVPRLPTICEQICVLHRERCYAIEQRKRAYNALGAYIRTQLGWNLGLSERERERIAKLAASAIFKNDDPRFSDIINATNEAASAFVSIEKATSKAMVDLAEQLPVWSAFRGVRGFGALGLAIVVGEAGDLSKYSNHSKLWKRMGVAVLDGIRQGGLGKGAPAEKWIEHGYSPKRRSRLWTIGDCLIKGNRDGKYRSAYLQRKAYELTRDPEMKPIAAHRRAQRYMEKKLLRDLWSAWNGQILGDNKSKSGVLSHATAELRAGAA